MTLRDERARDDRRIVRLPDVATVPASRQPPDEQSPRWWPYVAVAAVVVGVGLRLVSHGALWLDEAQSVSIAAEPLRHLPDALRHDGAPPLWYALLHFWLQAFGDSPWSVRMMASLPAVAALPLVFALTRRLAGREAAQYALVLLAASPFAIRYAVEARMYSLVLLLSLLGASALLAVHRRPGWPPVAALAAVSAALLYTHYYALWLVAIVALTELWRVVRRRDPASRRAVIGLAAGGIAFVPWLPVLLWQVGHTGAPWQPPPSLNAFLDTVFEWAGGADPAARLAGLAMLALVVLAVFGRSAVRGVVISRPAARVPLRLLAVVTGTIALAVFTAMASGNAYTPRYTSVVAGLFVMLVAMGVVVLPTRRIRVVVVTLLAVLGSYVGVTKVLATRTQAPQVAAAINEVAKPGDIVAYCPDQLGPSISRLVDTPARQVVFPDFAAPQRIDWVDYTQRMDAGQALTFAQTLERQAPHGTIWVVYAFGYHPVKAKCDHLLEDLAATRGMPVKAVPRRPHVWENAGLLGYRPRG